VLALRWYLRFGLSYRDVEELLAERGVQVDHVTVYRWVQRFTPLLAEAARPCRHAVGSRWYVDETYVKVAGCWLLALRVPRHRSGRSGHRRGCLPAARRQCRAPVLRAGDRHDEGDTGRGRDRPGADVPDGARGVAASGLAPHRRYANNHIEADHGRVKARLRPMRSLKQDRSARVIVVGHAFVQNVRRGHYELAVEVPANRRLAVAFSELAVAI
jgi:hypothetical protein